MVVLIFQASHTDSDELARLLQADEEAPTLQQYVAFSNDGQFEARIRPHVDRVQMRREDAWRDVAKEELEEKALVALAKTHTVNVLRSGIILERRVKLEKSPFLIVKVLQTLEMASFAGTTQKCKACEKTVYLVDQLTADNKVYHKSCFRCHHCKGTLKLSNFSSFEGVLYCKPHFDQLFKMTGSLERSFEGNRKITKIDRSIHQVQTNSKISSLFAGTQDKCVACKKTVYPIEKVAVDGSSYHKACFRCTHGGCVISPSNYVAHEQRLYCRHHHTQLFKAKGNFSQLDKHQEQVKVAAAQNPTVK